MWTELGISYLPRKCLTSIHDMVGHTISIPLSLVEMVLLVSILDGMMLYGAQPSTLNLIIANKTIFEVMRSSVSAPRVVILRPRKVGHSKFTSGSAPNTGNILMLQSCCRGPCYDRT